MGIPLKKAKQKARSGRRPRGSDLRVDDGSKSSLVNAVSRALAILDCFEQAERPLGNQDIALLTGLPKSTISRITRTLTELHYLHFWPDLERYHLGPRVVRLASAFQHANPLPTLIQPALQDLANTTRGTVGLGFVEGLDAVYLQVARGVSVIVVQVDVGTRMRLLDSALGLALVAGTPDKRRDCILAELKVQEKRRWSESQRRIASAENELAKRGYCTSIGTWNEDINGIAAPFRMVGESTVYAVNIGWPAFFIHEDTIHEVHGPKLLAMMADLESRGLITTAFNGV
jgi:DNA-binding IclR family transcriptional regulator